jgi:hypothetical protein
MAINANGTSSKPGDWAGGGSSGGGVYQEPGQRSSYDSKGNQLTGFNGANPGTPEYKGSDGTPRLGKVKFKNPIANLFRGGKGGPSGQVGTVNPALRTRRPVVPGAEAVSLPPPGQPDTGYGPNGDMSYADYVSMMIQAARNRMGNWTNQEYNPLSSIRSPRTVTPGRIPPNTGSGYTPQWDSTNAGNFQDLPGETSWRNPR